MPKDNQLVRELLEDARRMRTPEEKAAFEQKLMSTGENRVPYLVPRTVDEVKNPEVLSGSARPVDFIKPYYGDKFSTEVAKAMLYNARRPLPVLEPDSYSRLYDHIEFKRDKSDPEYPSYSSKDRKVTLSNAEGVRIEKSNLNFLKKALEGKINNFSKESRESLAESARKYPLENSFRDLDEMVKGAETDSITEHEFAHHATRPADSEEGSTPPWDAYYNALYAEESDAGDLADSHTVRPPELTQAAARFQRELFAHRGKRIENPDEFLKIVNSDDQLEFLTPEARRYLVFARRVANEKAKDSADTKSKERDKKYRSKTLKSMAEILPATVSTDDSFQSRVNERIANLAI